MAYGEGLSLLQHAAIMTSNTTFRREAIHMMRKMSATVFALKVGALSALLPLVGCFTYIDSTLGEATPGTQARIRLDDDSFGRVVNQAAMNGFPITSLDMNRKGIVGRILEVGPDNVSVQMRGTGSSMFTAEVLSNGIQSVAVRSFSPKRTVAVIAIGFVLGATLGSGVVGGTTGQAGDPPEPFFVEIPFVSIPLVSIPFP
jgi:hypothetical protein